MAYNTYRVGLAMLNGVRQSEPKGGRDHCKVLLGTHLFPIASQEKEVMLWGNLVRIYYLQYR